MSLRISASSWFCYKNVHMCLVGKKTASSCSIRFANYTEFCYNSFEAIGGNLWKTVVIGR